MCTWVQKRKMRMLGGRIRDKVERRKEERRRRWRGRRRWCSYPASWPLVCVCPAMASMMESCEYILMGVLYWAWMMVALPPGPFTSMGLLVERAVCFSTLGLKPALSGWEEEGKRWGYKEGDGGTEVRRVGEGDGFVMLTADGLVRLKFSG